MVSRALQGVFRSLRLYHGPRAPRAEMDAFYRSFVDPGDLVFDIGAHVGDRVSSFRRLGARVVAVEPQWLLASALRHIHGRDPLVDIVSRAVGEKAGKTLLRVNTDNPTVSTVSEQFVEGARGSARWKSQVWDDGVEVDVVTLDGLIARYGPPSFVKIDTEGSEDAVLRGLSHVIPKLSFEFTTIARDVAARCLERLSLLGDYRCNLVLGESWRMTSENWLSTADMSKHLDGLPHEVNSGDVYAALLTPPYDVL